MIGRQPSFRFRQRTVDLTGLRTGLGAGYALTGRVKCAGGYLQVAATLIKTGTGSVIWAVRLNSGLDDICLAREQIVATATGALDLHILQAKVVTARGKPTDMLGTLGRLTSWDKTYLPH